MTLGVLDTSIFIAREQRRAVSADRIPDRTSVSVVTFAELALGVHLAADESRRAVRLATLQSVRSAYMPLPIDDAVAAAFAELVAEARGHGRRPKVQDAWIAATARTHGAAVCTQDADFDDLDVDVLRV